jgi:hypothetical protein
MKIMPSYPREVRQRTEALTSEEAEATMALYGSPEQCEQKLQAARTRSCPGGGRMEGKREV